MKNTYFFFFLLLPTIAFSQYQIQQPQEPVNFQLVGNALNTLQTRYDYNLQMVRTAENTCFDLIKSKAKEYNKDYATYIKIHNRFVEEYVNPVRNKGYDYSNKSLTLKVVDYLFEGTTKILLEEL